MFDFIIVVILSLAIVLLGARCESLENRIKKLEKKLLEEKKE